MKYNPLPVPSVLSVASLQEAFRLAGDQPTYEVHVPTAQVSNAQAICDHFLPTIAVTVVADDTLFPTEWYALALRVAVAFGSRVPR